MKLSDFVEFVYGKVLDKSFIVDSELLADDSLITVNFRKMTLNSIEAEAKNILELHGFSVQGSNVLRMVKNKEDVKQHENVFVYRPLYRSVSYLLDLSVSLFKNGSFVSSRRSASPLPQGVGLPPTQQHEQGLNATADRSVDVLVFNGSDADIVRLKALLAQVDKPVGQVVVRAHVYEVTTGIKEGSGFSLALDLLGLRFSLGQFKNLGNTLRIQKGGFDLALSALASDSRFKIISSPSLRVKSGENARFSVGSDVPVLGSVQMDKNGNPINSVEYKASGVILDLVPKIRGEEIELQINQQLSSFIPTTTGVNNSPTLLKREIQTNVGVMDGDVIVLGGLDENKSSNDSSGLPFLPAFLRSSGREDSKTELLLVLETQKI